MRLSKAMRSSIRLVQRPESLAQSGPSGTRPDGSLASSSDTVEGHTDPLSEHVHRCRRVAMISANFSPQN